jgi:Spy/CpxP family protein refolding chaperone
MEQMMGPMTRVMAFSPAHLLMHKEVLNLTDPQVAKLTALRDAMKPAHDAAMADLQTHSRAMMTVMTGASPDTTQLKLHFQAMQAAMVKGHWAMLSAAAQARGLLTDTQRARADGWADAMEHMMPMMDRGMPRMPGGPGMMREHHDSEHHEPEHH